jgi:DNA invertase Pin-like site-specific DNA recombinase
MIQMKVIIYSRVSTNHQDYKRQTEELMDYSSKMGWIVLGTFEEKISGEKENQERPKLMEMISFVKNNKVDKVLCWELSRIGRNTIEVLKTIKLLTDNMISLYIKNYNIETLVEGKVNPLSSFMIQVLTSVSEMERTTIRQRIKSGYDSYISNGGKVGRKVGFRKDNETIINENTDVIKLLRKGYSVRKIMVLTNRSSGTIMKIKKTLQDKEVK